MTMIPTAEQGIDGAVFLAEEWKLGIYPSRTHEMDLERGVIIGHTDGLAAMNQVIYKALLTQRSAYMAYSDNYGMEMSDLIGMPISYVLPEIKRRVTEALTWDTRIDSVDGFAFETGHGKVHASFTVHTIYGDLPGGMEVLI